MKSIHHKINIALIAAFLFTNVTMAQGTENNPGDDPDIPNIPLDGGLSILAIAGVAYASKKYHNYRKVRNNTGNKDSTSF